MAAMHACVASPAVKFSVYLFHTQGTDVAKTAMQPDAVLVRLQPTESATVAAVQSQSQRRSRGHGIPLAAAGGPAGDHWGSEAP